MDAQTILFLPALRERFSAGSCAMDRFDDASSSSSSSSSPSSKRRRRPCCNDDGDARCSRRPRKSPKKHLYLAVDDWSGGFSIHKIDADDILGHDGEEPPAATARRRGLHKLPEPAALRLASPVDDCPMAFAALGTNIVIATNPRRGAGRTEPTFVYDTETAALTAGPRLPDGLDSFGAAVAVGRTLYAVTSHTVHEPPSLQLLSWAPAAMPCSGRDFWDPAMEWSWSRSTAPPPELEGYYVTAYALHPDRRTIFITVCACSTFSFDTGDGVWRHLGDWALPFRGQACFDGDLGAWVGLHGTQDGYVCCSTVASRSAAADRPPECTVLKEKLFCRSSEKKFPDGRFVGASLSYMGDSRFCLVEKNMRGEDFRKSKDAVLHVTFFGLKYDQNGELQTKIRRATRSYAVSTNKSFSRFSNAAFWM
ncbi:hypothetical protein ACP4OV_007204 [Aristida adscensionis]